MKDFWGSLVIGVVLLGGVVAFALLPGTGEDDGDSEETTALAVEARDPAGPEAIACRAYLLGRDRARIDAAVANVSESLQFERQGGDGGLGFHDWLDGDQVQQALMQVAAAGELAARTPGLADDLFDVFRDVAASATELEGRAISGTMFVTPEVESALLDLTGALATAGDTCD